MRERYAAIVARRDGNAMPERWRTLLQSHGLRHCCDIGAATVFAHGSMATTVSTGRICVLGSLVDRRDGTPVDLAALPPTTDVARWIVERAWGRYIALAAAERPDAIDLLRDPAGFLSCCLVEHEDWIVVASDARLIVELGLADGRVDWGGVTAHLVYRDLRTRATCIETIREPLPGERVRITPGFIDYEPIWLPSRFCKASPPSSRGEAIERLAATVDQCVGMWTGRQDRLLLSLSGGLDSSIIAASVADAPGRLRGITLVSGRGLGDERDYAVALSRKIGIPLEIARVDGRGVDVGRSLAADQPRPSARVFTQPNDLALSQAAEHVGAHAFLNGGGGDAVFGFLHSANPAADRVKCEGLGRGFVRTVLDLAEITGCTPAHVGRRALAKAWFGRPRFRWAGLDTLMAPGVVERLPEATHPWLDDLRMLLPGQREHALSILRCLNTVDHLNIEGNRPTFYPLLSQPLVEFCLGIPSWWQCEGGRDRAVARAAFGIRFPAAVAQRPLKGNFSALVASITEIHRSRIREMLLEGELARRHLIDVDEVRRTLDPIRPVGDNYPRLLQFVDAEAWASAWT